MEVSYRRDGRVGHSGRIFDRLEVRWGQHNSALLVHSFKEPTLDLIRDNFGDRVEIRGQLQGTASVISTEKAQRMLGWKPRYDWTAS